jgi:hypothetical protein
MRDEHAECRNFIRDRHLLEPALDDGSGAKLMAVNDRPVQGVQQPRSFRHHEGQTRTALDADHQAVVGRSLGNQQPPRLPKGSQGDDS